MVTALYLAHLNPVTNAHVEIVRELQDCADHIKVMPVVFRDGQREINSKSFPFSFEIRQKMLNSVVDADVEISDDYQFVTPFKRYIPPILSPMSWRLRTSILHGVDEDYFSYTGDRAEGIMLRLYGLRPRVGQRRALSAASVKNHMYQAATGSADNWSHDVPSQVARIIQEEWETVKHYANMADDTIRIAGMKFPRDGW